MYLRRNMGFLLTLTAFCAIAFLLLRLVAYIQFVRKCAPIPTISDSLPGIGHAHHLLKDSIKILEFIEKTSRETNQLGGVSKLWIGPFPAGLVCVTDPDDVFTVSNTCLRKTYNYRFTDTWIGNGLVTSIPTTWKRHRKLLNPSFSQQCLNGFLEVFNEQSAVLVQKLAPHVGNVPFEHNDILFTFAIDTVCRTVFGNSDTIMGKREHKKEYQESVETVSHVYMQRNLHFWMHFDFLFKYSKLKKVEEKAVNLLRATSWDALKKAQLFVGEENKILDDRFRPLINSLIDLIADGSMTEREVQEQLDTLIFAGHDTSATTLLYIFMAIGSYPEVQERIYKEFQEVFGDSTRNVTKDDLKKLVYLEAVIKEVSRLYPVAPVVMRAVDQDIKCKNVTIPSGTNAVICIWGVNRSSAWGADADQFDPDRWLDAARLPSNPAAFATFSIGKRGCIAKLYAMMFMKTTMVHVLRKYRLKSDISKLKLQLVLMLKPVSGCEISIESRDA